MMMVKQDHMAAYEIEFSADAREEDRQVLSHGLDDFNRQFLGTPRTSCFGFIRHNGVLVGGLRAESYGDGFYIKHLWLDEAHRGQGWGKVLMEKAETEATDRKCRTLWVDTMSYQAPEFYQKLGYRETARVEGYREAYDRIFYKKDIG